MTKIISFSNQYYHLLLWKAFNLILKYLKIFNILVFTVYLKMFCPLSAYRRDHLHAAAVSGGAAD